MAASHYHSPRHRADTPPLAERANRVACAALVIGENALLRSVHGAWKGLRFIHSHREAGSAVLGTAAFAYMTWQASRGLGDLHMAQSVSNLVAHRVGLPANGHGAEPAAANELYSAGKGGAISGLSWLAHLTFRAAHRQPAMPAQPAGLDDLFPPAATPNAGALPPAEVPAHVSLAEIAALNLPPAETITYRSNIHPAYAGA